MREQLFAKGEYYHIFNQGVDKRLIVEDKEDIDRFLQSMDEFNVVEPIGSIFENSFQLEEKKSKNKLVDIVCYCLNPNHFHFLLYARQDDGISKFMHRLQMGYAKYFNQKYKRRGSLFQGTFKAKHVSDNDYFLHLAVYTSLNNKVHQLGHLVSKLVRSSWNYYAKYPEINDPLISGSEIVTSQFKNSKDFVEFAMDSLELMLERKKEEKELKDFLLDD